jgi:hypothetical protein
MKSIELFCGTQSFSKVAREMGFETFTSDSNKRFKSDYTINILNFDVKRVPFIPDVIWASPPCTYFSIASMWKHWSKDYTPKTLFAVCALDIVKKMLEVIGYFNKLNPNLKIYIENPRGMLRHTGLLDHFIRHTVTYCQYGETRMKPTDIWTNDESWKPRPMCEVTDKCHTTTTNDLTTAALRSVVPYELCKEILSNVQDQAKYYSPGLADP